MKIKYFGIFGLLILIVIIMLSFRPVPILDEEDCVVLEGTVTEIYEGGVKDVVLKLRGHSQVFYINRGLERGLDLEHLKADLVGREIVVKYPDHWTPMDITKSSIHISKIEHEGHTIFSELE